MRNCLFILTGFILLCSGCTSSQRHQAALPKSRPSSRVAVGEFYEYRVQEINVPLKNLRVEVLQLPGWLSYLKEEQALKGTAPEAGQYAISLRISDGQDTTLQNWMLTVYDSSTTNIVCLGNSITNGTDRFNSYRRPLWQMLHEERFNIDLVGSWNRHHMGGDVPNPDFDLDHEGHSGWRFDDLFHPPDWDSARGNIDTWLTQYRPDIVLVELGTNDVFQCRSVNDMLNDLERLVAVLRARNKSVKIFVAQIPPLGRAWADSMLCGNGTTYHQSILALNAGLTNKVRQLSREDAPCLVVDQFSGIETDVDLYDDIHPNEQGEKKMASRWLAAIRPFLKKLP